MAKITVLGFYGRQNLGDEAFKLAFPLLFTGAKFSFLDIDSTNALPKDTDMVICGGGDIVSDYFIPKIERLTKEFSGNIILFSAGIPYQSYVSSKVLDLFDYIYLRNSTDIKTVSNYIGHDYVKYIPDIVFSLPPPTRYLDSGKRKTVGVFMHRMATSGSTSKEIMASLAGSLKYIDDKGYRIVLYRFNHSKKSTADDFFINQEIKIKAPFCEVNNTPKEVMEMYNIFGTLEFAICGRLHSHIMAVGAGTPILSLSSTRKTKLFMKESGLEEYCINMKENPLFFPKFKFIVDKLMEEDHHSKILNISNNKRDLLNNSSYNKLLSLPKRVRTRKYNERNFLINYVKDEFSRRFSINLETLQDKEFVDLLDKDQIEVICRKVCFEITKRINPEYLWGFIETMQRRPSEYIKSIDYMINDSRRSFKGLRKFNIDYFNQGDFEDLHRSGWSYVMGKLSIFNTKDGIYLDTYIDRTFHWGEKTLISCGILPYSQHWVGIVHHTPMEEYSEYNVEELFQKESLLLSLHMCKGIYTLSYTLAEYIRNKLKELHFGSIIVENIYHPTEIVGSFWSPEKFKSNKNKKIVHIGAWLRDMFAIYRLSNVHKITRESQNKTPFMIKVGSLSNTLKFASLKGKKMEHYFKPDIVEINNYTVETDEGGIMCRSYNGQNKWVEGLSDFINIISTDVETITELSNNDYDKLLSSNIVFLKLLDASACNTLMECVARNTPLLVNPHPAVIEVLGEEYPMYYNNLYEANEKLFDYDKLIETYEYIKNMKKDCINADIFVRAIKESEIFKSI